ncbi:unnamed protein product [Pleuronectes platessa]|uniref:Uncharacterized protein n=1 Tax=Pleuronectes platessa TaxID=8262 RepID=A0A9N7UFA4_PLEPL|nr:unnamed protein product [Pleuronectes platessa]
MVPQPEDPTLRVPRVTFPHTLHLVLMMLGSQAASECYIAVEPPNKHGLQMSHHPSCITTESRTHHNETNAVFSTFVSWEVCPHWKLKSDLTSPGSSDPSDLNPGSIYRRLLERTALGNPKIKSSNGSSINIYFLTTPGGRMHHRLTTLQTIKPPLLPRGHFTADHRDPPGILWTRMKYPFTSSPSAAKDSCNIQAVPEPRPFGF